MPIQATAAEMVRMLQRSRAAIAAAEALVQAARTREESASAKLALRLAREHHERLATVPLVRHEAEPVRC